MRAWLTNLGTLLLAAGVTAQPVASAPSDVTNEAVPQEASDPAPDGRRLEITLDDAIRLAVENNLVLRASLLAAESNRHSVQEALAKFDPAFFASLQRSRSGSLFVGQFPGPGGMTQNVTISQVSDRAQISFGIRGQLETGMSYDLTFGTSSNDARQQNVFDPSYRSTVSLSVTQPLLRAAWSGYHLADLETTRLTRLESLETYRITRRDKIGEVQNAFFDYVFALEDLKVKLASLKLANDQVAITKQKVTAGALAEIEITSAQSAAATRSSDAVAARAAVVTAEDSLRRLILSFAQDSDWSVKLTPRASLEEDAFKTIRPVEEIVRLAERSHPELLQAYFAAARARIALHQARSDKLPSLDLTGSVSLAGLTDVSAWQSWEDALRESRQAASWDLGLAFEYPIGNRAAAARVAQARIAVRSANIDLREARTNMVFAIRSAIRNVDVAKQSIVASKEAVRLGQEQLVNERLRLELRRSTNFQVFQVEEDLNQRRTNLIQARIDYQKALLELSRASGVPLIDLVIE